MTGAQVLPPEGYLALADAVDHAQSLWGLGNQSKAAELIQGGVNTYAGGVTWVDADYDEGVSPERLETWSRLRHALANSKVSSWVLRASCDLQFIPPDAWRRKENADADLTGEINYIAGTETIRGDVLIKLADLQDFFSGKLTESLVPLRKISVAIQSEAPNKGGRPTTHDWDAMWVEVIRTILYDHLPPKRADLQKRLQDWFSECGLTVPSDSVMKEKLGPLYALIDAEDKKAGN
jgi:hypothetical protein